MAVTLQCKPKICQYMRTKPLQWQPKFGLKKFWNALRWFNVNKRRRLKLFSCIVYLFAMALIIIFCDDTFDEIERYFFKNVLVDMEQCYITLSLVLLSLICSFTLSILYATPFVMYWHLYFFCVFWYIFKALERTWHVK